MTAGPEQVPGRTGPLTVHVGGVPDPFLLRGAVADRLAGRPSRPGAEAAVAEAVAEHLSWPGTRAAERRG